MFSTTFVQVAKTAKRGEEEQVLYLPGLLPLQII